MSTAAKRYAYHTSATVQIVARWCPNCGIPYGVPEGFIEERQENHKTWYRPNGCAWHFLAGPTKTERELREARRGLDAARSIAQRESRRRQRAEAEARTSAYRARAAKGQLTKTKKRIAAGVCPCCSRSFQNLARHMAGQHPDYAVPEEQA